MYQYFLGKMLKPFRTSMLKVWDLNFSISRELSGISVLQRFCIRKGKQLYEHVQILVPYR